MATTEQPARPSLEDVQRKFEETRQRIREIEEREDRDQPRRSPGGNDSGTPPPAQPPKIP